MAKSIWQNYDSLKEGIEESRSAIRWPEKIQKPTLIMLSVETGSNGINWRSSGSMNIDLRSPL